jgi:L-threonylcarbamoyladenylate synthase
VLAEAAAHLAAGRVVAFPTETFYGLAADPRDAAGVAAVYAIKGRTFTEALPLIAAGREIVEGLVGGLSADARRLADRFWPGPLTLVLPLPGGALVPAVSAGRATIAVRVSDHPVARALAAAAGGLITSTSANRSGEPPATTATGAAALGDGLALTLDGGPAPGWQPSTIVDVTGPAVRLLRAGRVPFDRVLESLQ